MTRLAFVLIFGALVAVVLLSVEMTGRSAIVFSFVGAPMLVAGIGLYGVQRWREGAFRSSAARNHQRERSSG